jgi:hypothetical protein
MVRIFAQRVYSQGMSLTYLFTVFVSVGRFTGVGSQRGHDRDLFRFL